MKKRVPAQEHAVLRARYAYEREPHVDNKGKTTHRTRNQRLVVQNSGAVAAANVSVELRGLNETSSPPELITDGTSPTLIPNSDFSWPLIMAMGMARTFEVLMTWKEGEDEHTESQHVSA